MVNQDLLNYITSQREEGVGDETIAAALEDAGWDKTDIRDGFASLEEGVSPDQVVGSGGGLMPIDRLLSDSFQIFKQKFVSLITVAFVTEGLVLALQLGFQYLTGASMISTSATGGLASSGTATIGITIVSIVSIIIQTWGALAMLHIVREQGGVLNPMDAFQRSFARLFSYWGLVFSVLLIIMGGLVLLIVPGVIVGVWLFLSAYVMVDENTGIVDSIQRSREYVRGHWWSVLGRIFVLAILAGTLGAAIGMIVGIVELVVLSGSSTFLSTISGSLMSVLTYPFSLIVGYLIYKDLRQIEGDVQSDSDSLSWVFIAFGILGLLVFVLPLIVTMLIPPLYNVNTTF